MSYDLGRLSSDEFEELAADIISEIEQCRVEVYKAGQDQGIDGKFRTWNDGKGIIQAKHWIKSPFNKLLNEIKTKESVKAKKLNADKYIFFTSKELSPNNKNKIMEAFDGCVKTTEDIFGYNDISRFLKANAEVERRNFKLWLSSSSVMMSILHSNILGESDFTLKQMYEGSKSYIALSNHSQAMAKLIKNRVLIITGSPGNGKTTLAKNLCLQLVGDGYKLVNVGSDINSVSGFINGDNKVVFYFDDFLGRNYIDATSDRIDSSIISFMKRVQNEGDAYFILTSRSNILTRRKSEVEDYKIRKVDKNEYELDIGLLSFIDKARILKSHMYHSDLERGFIESILQDKFYLKIVMHRNFNPRIIEYLLDSDRLFEDNIRLSEYKEHMIQRLEKPNEIWDICFQKQAYDLKIIMLAISYFGKSRFKCTESELREFYETVKVVDKNFGGRDSFDCLNDCLKPLTNSMINRNVIEKTGVVYYDTFNPSINDFIYDKYFLEYTTLANVISSYKSHLPLVSFSYQYKKINNLIGLRVFEKVILNVNEYSLVKSDEYLMRLMDLYHTFASLNDSKMIYNFSRWLNKNDYRYYTPRDVTLFFKNLNRVGCHDDLIVKPELQFSFLIRCIENCNTFSDVEVIAAKALQYKLLKIEHLEKVLAPVAEDILCDEIQNNVEFDALLHELYPGDEGEAESIISDHVSELIDSLGLFNLSFEINVDSIVSCVDIDSLLKINAEENYSANRSREDDSSDSDDTNEIDGIFDEFEFAEE
jgi:hypothetical protein